MNEYHDPDCMLRDKNHPGDHVVPPGHWKIGTKEPTPEQRLLGQIVRWWHTEGTDLDELEPLIDAAQEHLRRTLPGKRDPFWDVAA